MRFLLFLLGIFALCVGLAQAQEVQVAMDDSGRVQCVDAALARKLSLFTEYEGLTEACLYQISDSTYALEVLCKRDGKVVRERVMKNATEVAELRRTISLGIALHAPATGIDQSGRSKLVGGCLALGLLYHGWAIPAAGEARDPTGATTLYFLASSAGFFVPFLITQNTEVTQGEAAFAIFAGTRGIGHGMMVELVVNGEDADGNRMLGYGSAFGIAELIGGYQIARATDMSDGTATTIAVMHDLGVGMGLGAAHLSGAFDADDANRPAATWVLAGAGAGIVSGAILARGEHFTRGDAYVLRSAALLGAYLPVPFVEMSDPPQSGNTYAVAAMTGTVAGLSVGYAMARGRDFTAQQGTLISLGEVAGALFGLAVVVGPASNSEDGGSAYLWGAAIGATTGLAVTYATFARDARVESRESSWDLHLNWPGIAALVQDAHLSSSPQTPMPLVDLTIRF